MINFAKRVAWGMLQGQRFYRGKAKITELIEQIESRIHQEQLVKDEGEEEILKNYIELTEESYL